LACICLLSQSSLHGGTLEFAERVPGNPPSRTRALLADFLAYANRFAVQPKIPLPNIVQSPVDRLSHKIALIIRFPFNDP